MGWSRYRAGKGRPKRSAIHRMEEEIQERMQYLNEYAECHERRQEALWCDVQRYGAMVQWRAIGAIVGYIVNLPIPPKPLSHMAHSPICHPPTSLRIRLIAQNDPWCHIAPEALRTHPDARAHRWAPCQLL